MSAFDLHHYTCGPLTIVVAHYIEHGGHTELRGFYVGGHTGREVEPEDEKAPFLEAGRAAGYPASLSADEVADRLGRDAITAYGAGRPPYWAHRTGGGDA